ncbi:hypothetical protein BDZ45DRAFT_684660 [Acephala macrosclerotiorum]|nr:hypothetical protein BDZ45DRAFT_684660 [Acephala macrosclerotiorum]
MDRQSRLPTEKAPLVAANNPITSQEVVSGAVGPHEGAVDAQQLPARPDQSTKPWSSFSNFLVFMRERARRIGLSISREKPRRPRRLFRRRRTSKRKEAASAPLFSSHTTEIRRSQSLQPEIRSADANNKEEHNVDTEGGIVGKSIPLQDQNGVRDIEGAMNGPSNAFMAERLPQTATGVASGHSSPKLSQSPKAMSLKQTADRNTGPRDSLEINIESGHSRIGSETSGSRTYSETDCLVKGYVPRKAREDDYEFTCSAVMMKDGSGHFRAVKLFYDSMSTDNWASEAFVKAYRLKQRPIRPEDLKVYGTVGEEFTPTHYAEIELQDDSRGMKDFTKLIVNITPSMDGIGLIAGRIFMRKHEIKIDSSASRDNFVTTGRKAGLAAREAQRQLLEKAKEEYKLAKELSASTAGPSTQRSGISSEEKLMAPSSRTSTSSDVKSNVSKR